MNIGMNYCELCFPKAICFGEIFPGHDFIFEEHYKIVKEHDEVVRFPGKPLPDPYDGMTNEQVDASPIEYQERFIQLSEYDNKFRKLFQFHPQQGHEIVELCKKVGYDPKNNGWLDFWLVNRAYKMIEAKEKA